MEPQLGITEMENRYFIIEFDFTTLLVVKDRHPVLISDKQRWCIAKVVPYGYKHIHILDSLFYIYDTKCSYYILRKCSTDANIELNKETTPTCRSTNQYGIFDTS